MSNSTRISASLALDARTTARGFKHILYRFKFSIAFAIENNVPYCDRLPFFNHSKAFDICLLIIYIRVPMYATQRLLIVSYMQPFGIHG